MPETQDTASFFSFYDVTEKIAIVIGTFTFGYIDDKLGMKNSVLEFDLILCVGIHLPSDHQSHQEPGESEKLR